MPVIGVPIVGDIDTTGVFRDAEKVTTPDLEDFMSTSSHWNTQVAGSPKPLPEQVEAVWEKSKKEIECKILGDLLPKSHFDKLYGENGWRCMQRFAVFQEHNQDWRVIDNGRTSGHNGQAEMTERIHTTATAVSMAMSQFMAKLNPGGRQFRATRDMKKAYRQIPAWARHMHLHIIAIWSPVHDCWMFAELRGLAFGLAVAVIQFNRVPTFLVAVARRWLGIPAISFFDDVRMLAPDHCKEAVWAAFNWLVKQLGWQFDDSKDSPAPWLKRARF